MSRHCFTHRALALMSLMLASATSTPPLLPALNATKAALATELALKAGGVAIVNAELARFTGNVTCFMDAAGLVVGLQLGVDPPLCSSAGATARRFVVPSDSYIAALAVAVDPDTQLIGQLVYTVKSDASTLPTNIVSCGSQGLKVPVNIMPKQSALASLSATCRAAATTPGRRRLQQQQAVLGLDPASLRVHVTTVDAGPALAAAFWPPLTPAPPPPPPPSLVLYTLQYSRGTPTVNKLYRCPVDAATSTATCTSVTLAGFPVTGAISIGRLVTNVAYITSSTIDSQGYFACSTTSGTCSSLQPWTNAPTLPYAICSVWDGATWFVRELNDLDGVFYACDATTCTQLLWTFPGGVTYPSLQGLAESSDPTQLYVLANKFPPNPHGLFLCPKNGGPCTTTPYDAGSLVANGQVGLWVDATTGTAYVADQALAHKLYACPVSGAPCGQITLINGPVSDYNALTLAVGVYGAYE